MRNRKYSFDPKCLDLAIYFYPAASADRLNNLARQIQDVVESEDLEAPAPTATEAPERGTNGGW